MSTIADSDDREPDSFEDGEQPKASYHAGDQTARDEPTPSPVEGRAGNLMKPSEAGVDSLRSKAGPIVPADGTDPAADGGSRRMSGRPGASSVEAKEHGSSARGRSDSSPAEESKSKPSDIKSVLMLLEYAYSQAGKQVKIPQLVFKQIARNLDETEANPQLSMARLAELSAEDPLIAVPPRLMASVETSNESIPLRRLLTDLMLEVLAQHRVFRSEKVRAVLSGESRNIDEALRSVSLACSDVTAEDLGMRPPMHVKAAERERLRVNAIISLALLLSLRDAWSVADLVDYLYVHLWQETTKKPSVRPPKVAVTESPGLDSLGVVARAYRSQVDRATKTASEANERMAAAERHVQMATTRATESELDRQRIKSALAASEAEIASLRETLTELRAEIDAERRDRVIDKSHHVDDYETLRTSVTRLLDRQVDLLSDGLHALRNGSNSITDEYIERSVHALNKELAQLRDLEEE